MLHMRRYLVGMVGLGPSSSWCPVPYPNYLTPHYCQIKGLVACVYNPHIFKMQTGRSRVQGQPQLHKKFETLFFFFYWDSYLRKQEEKEENVNLGQGCPKNNLNEISKSLYLSLKLLAFFFSPKKSKLLSFFPSSVGLCVVYVLLQLQAH